MKFFSLKISAVHAFKVNLVQILVLGEVLFGIGATAHSQSGPLPNSVTIMSYNVENLFDTLHDNGKSDESFLPIDQKRSPEHIAKCNQIKVPVYKVECLNLDWNDRVLEAKLNNLSSVIGSAGSNGPDVLILEEVENMHVLSLLNQKLAPLGYKTQVLIEGPDQRGIDQAVLSKLPLLAQPRLHRVPFQGLSTPEDLKKAESMRGILEVNLQLPDGQMLTVFGGHFSSQQNPRIWRENYVAFAKAIFSQRTNELIVFGADSNITGEEESATGFFRNELGSVSLISHLAGCNSCEGTHYYRGTWGFLDVLMFSKNFDGGLLAGKTSAQTNRWSLEVSSVQTIRTNVNLNKDGTPHRFEPITGTGASDHLPIFARIIKN